MKKIYLVDWNSFIYRMFFALPEFSTKSWKVVNATFWMAKFFLEQLKKENPDYLIFIKDAKWENFRHKIYSDYKATRERMPDNLRSQISDIESMINLMNIKIIEIDWYEADDVIWTLAKKFDQDKNYEIDILTWDKDLYSLVSSNIKIYDTMKKKKFWVEEAREKFWIDSHMVIDYLAIVWDKSDNIPWIDWFWPQKAIDLINNIWSVEEIYETVDKFENWEELGKCYPELDSGSLKKLQSIFKWKTYEKLKSGRERAFLSKKLATLDKKVELKDFSLDDYLFDTDNLLNDNSKEFFKELEFFSLVWEDEKTLKIWKDLWLKVKVIWDKQGLDELEKSISKYDKIILDTETTSLDVYKAELVWVSIYLDDKNIFYINVEHIWSKVDKKYFKYFLSVLLKNDDLTIVWHNLKYDLEILELFLNRKDDNLLDGEHYSQISLWI